MPPACDAGHQDHVGPATANISPPFVAGAAPDNPTGLSLAENGAAQWLRAGWASTIAAQAMVPGLAPG
ncbi:hypothetical protein Y88_1230 [Novosphingobium nitrogenifigens DSM 19370]|uniref:Uncharacterized protein n=1 Tax=Novosphingobium nitrogenifigens DSM 19370 TaxID=983920 RepID=F1Z857_9SPHN|nr:hypothetical protein Y88_1230 [Novosphingobium nitrogenifigens DSM 19370]